jgi:hypothetical protein
MPPFFRPDRIKNKRWLEMLLQSIGQIFHEAILTSSSESFSHLCTCSVRTNKQQNVINRPCGVGTSVPIHVLFVVTPSMNLQLNIRPIQAPPMITDWVLHLEIVVTSFIWIVFRDGYELGVFVHCVTRSGTLPKLSVSLAMGRDFERLQRSLERERELLHHKIH